MRGKCGHCVLGMVLIAVGCDRSTPSTVPAEPSEPSMTRRCDQEAVLGDLLGLKAYVYEFSGTFLELWLEGEIEDGKTKEKKRLPSFGPVTVARERFEGRTGSIAERLKGQIVVWEEDGGATLKLRVSADVSQAEATASDLPGGTTGVSGNTWLPIPAMPKMSSLSGSGGRGSDIPDLVELPQEIEKEFTVFWYSREEHQREPESGEKIASRTVTVRLKGRLLAEEVPEFRNEPDDNAAVAALESLDASIQRFDNGSVRSIYFGKSNAVTDDDLAHLRGLPNLESLEIHSPDITDAGLEHLKTLTTLKELNLHSTNVTDAGLEHLIGLTGLKTLNLHGTKIKPEGVDKLKQALPQCKILGGPVKEEAKKVASPGDTT